MKLRRYLYNTLEFVAIVDEMDCPVDPYVSSYINIKLSNYAPNTKVRYAYELLFVLKYFAETGVDLPSRVASGQFISQWEYHRFYDRAFVNADDECRCPLGFRDLSSKYLRNAMVASRTALSKVANETALGRIRRLRKFFEWLYGIFHDVSSVDRVVSRTYVKLVSNMKLSEGSIGKNSSQEVVDPTQSVIADAMFIKLLGCSSPSSLDNPFKRSKFRNYLIVHMLAQSGIRRGALAKLKISDLVFHGTCDQMLIYRSGNDRADSRLEKPNQKTRDHVAVIRSTLMEQLKRYIDEVRAVFPKSALHDYLFVSENDSKGTAGQPLSLKSINSIFQVLSKSLGFHIHPHKLRHKWNEDLSIAGEAIGMDFSAVEDSRKYAMGWSQNSTMVRVYNDRRLAVKVRELSQAHQRRIDELK